MGCETPIFDLHTSLFYCSQKLVHQPTALAKYTHLLFDEVHERSMDSDLLLLVVRELTKKGWAGRLVLMSATLDKGLADYFCNPCCHFVGAKRYRVEEACLDELSALKIPSEASPALAKILTQMVSRLPFKTGGVPKPGIESKIYKIIGYTLLVFSRLGTTSLVFLPGMVEITTLYDVLLVMIEEEGLTNIELFVLHSQIPLEEQASAFIAPTKYRRHIILATNIAESSLTIPRLGLVVNTVLQQFNHFDTAQQMSVLRKAWCSKAACTQRAGRAGREFPGLVIHTIPRSFYTILPDFNTPEMNTAPLDKLYLNARNIGQHFGIKSPCTFLSLAPSPPLRPKLQDAIRYLAELGAIVSQPGKEPHELAELTQLGHLAVSLPVDTRLAKLVLIGCCIGMAYEAVVISAYLTIDCDVFITPTPFSTKSPHKYAEMVSQSVKSRYSCDGGELADTWLVFKMFDSWLHFLKTALGTDTKSHCMKQFGAMWGVYPYRLCQLEAQVSMLARSLRSITTGDIRAQMDKLCHLHTVRGKAGKIECPNTATEPLRFKAMLFLAFPDQMMFGHAEAYSGIPGVDAVAKEELSVMEENGFEPSQTVTIRKLIGKSSKPESLQNLVHQVFIGQTFKTKHLLFKETAYIQAKADSCEGGASEGIRYLWCYADRGKGGWSSIGSPVKYPIIRHPLQVYWQRLSRATEIVRNLSFRNPAGLVLDFDKDKEPFLAVACSMTIRGENFVTSRMVTVMPRENVTAIICMLASLPLYSELDFFIGQHGISRCKIAGVVLESQLSRDTISKINVFREHLSTVWKSTSLSNLSKLCAVKIAFDSLFETVQATFADNFGSWTKIISPPLISCDDWETDNTNESADLRLHDFIFYPPLSLDVTCEAIVDYSTGIPQTENWDI